MVVLRVFAPEPFFFPKRPQGIFAQVRTHSRYGTADDASSEACRLWHGRIRRSTGSGAVGVRPTPPVGLVRREAESPRVRQALEKPLQERWTGLSAHTQRARQDKNYHTQIFTEIYGRFYDEDTEDTSSVYKTHLKCIARQQKEPTIRHSPSVRILATRQPHAATAGDPKRHSPF